jgi:hypothetical protein
MQTVTQQKKVKEVMKKVSYLFFMYNTLQSYKHCIVPKIHIVKKKNVKTKHFLLLFKLFIQVFTVYNFTIFFMEQHCAHTTVISEDQKLSMIPVLHRVTLEQKIE